jgi:HAD superfamily hydrolase (TIGR01509 family)
LPGRKRRDFCGLLSAARSMKRLIIFDFDGVLADSELLANTVLAEAVSDLGVPTTAEDSLRLFVGKRFEEVIAGVAATIGRAVPTDFPQVFQQRTLQRFRDELQMVDGARAYIDAFRSVPRCIASSSSPDRLALCLDVLKLAELFGPHVFSASQVARGKPHPDVFLHAAEQMGVAPRDALVIEDSAGGVQAALAAGMTVIGLLAASHIRDGHAERLKAAGAHYVAATFAEAERLSRVLLDVAHT